MRSAKQKHKQVAVAVPNHGVLNVWIREGFLEEERHDLDVLKDESEFFQIDKGVKGMIGLGKVSIKAQKQLLTSTNINLLSIILILYSILILKSWIHSKHKASKYIEQNTVNNSWLNILII